MNKDKAFTINWRINILPSNFPGKREEYYNLQFKSIWSKALSISFHNKPKTFISTSSTSLMLTLTIQKYMETVTTSLNKWHWSKLSLSTVHIFAMSIFINKNLSISRENKNEDDYLPHQGFAGCTLLKLNPGVGVRELQGTGWILSLLTELARSPKYKVSTQYL